MTSQRQYRVAEELRHALAKIVNDGGSPEPELFDVNITVTEVRISPDLQNATVFVLPLGGKNALALTKALNRAVGYFRHKLAQAVQLRMVPKLRFEIDTSFDTAERIEHLLQDEKSGH